jgi:hypothetical protein
VPDPSQPEIIPVSPLASPAPAPGGAAQPVLHRPGIVCPACGYDLSGVAHGPCPECGRLCAFDATDIANQRADIADPRAFRQIAIACAAIPIIYPVGVMILLGETATALPAAIACLIAVTGSIGVAWPLSLLWPAHHRATARAIWIRRVWILNLPWLVAPVLALLAVSIEILARVALNRSGVVLPVALGGFMIWMGGGLLYGIVWLGTIYEWFDRAKLRVSPSVALAVFLVGAAIWVVSLLFGFLGGAASALGSVDLADRLGIEPSGSGMSFD